MYIYINLSAIIFAIYQNLQVDIGNIVISTIVDLLFASSIFLGAGHTIHRFYTIPSKEGIIQNVLKNYIVALLAMIGFVIGIIYNVRKYGRYSATHFGDLYENTFLSGNLALLFILTVLLVIISVPIRWLFQTGVLGGGEQKMSIEESKNVISGMLHSTSKINIKEVAEITGETENFWKARIYGLLGSQDISGDFDGEEFILSEGSDVEEMIDHLLKEYEESETTKFGKIE
jgi:hypothetical protein